ncbi:Co-chaperone Hsc20 [Biscogniauxia mediterranea]|nr:Co-chaperone Hsc20 [Biscogniauxia mediterranea]
MRSPILPMRQAGRLCDACRHARSHGRSPAMLSSSSLSSPSSSNSSYAAPARTMFSVSVSASAAGTAVTARRASHHRIPCARQFSTSSAHLQSPQPSPTKPKAGEVEAEAGEREGEGEGEGKGEGEQQEKTATTTATATVPRSHYDFFPKTLPAGPPPRGPFAIDTRELRREFLALQGSAHPDLHPAHLKGRAEAASARINEAYRALEGSLSRAQHVLALRGAADAAADEAAKVEDPELLMLVLETREAIEEARDEAELEPIRQENERRVRESEDVLERAFAEDDLKRAAREVVRLRYWVNIRECIRNWERGKPVVLEH